MHQELTELLSKLDRQIQAFTPEELQKQFDLIPLEVFGSIQIDRPAEFPNLLNWLPKMPSDDVQQSWTGATGHQLMNQSINFIRLIVSNYHALTAKPISHANVLDFGCGWGRLTRLLYKYVPVDNIYAVDPWDRSIELCKQCHLYGNFYLSEYLPKSLPTPENLKFDFILAFSVFTHLSEKATQRCMNALRNSLTEDGVIAVTIRPKEYWQFSINNPSNQEISQALDQLLSAHNRHGFAFYPHNRQKIEDDITYGDTSMSLGYIRNNFRGLDIVGIEWGKVDSYQIVVFLQQSGS